MSTSNAGRHRLGRGAGRELESSTEKDRTALRIGLIQQLRTVFFQVEFRPHSIVGLIEVRERPRIRKVGFGHLPRPIEVHVIDEVERYFLGHRFFGDDPEELAGLGGDKGIVRPRFA